MATLVRTDDVVSNAELIDILGTEDDEDPLGDDKVIAVCAGEWRRENDARWRFWRDPTWQDD